MQFVNTFPTTHSYHHTPFAAIPHPLHAHTTYTPPTLQPHSLPPPYSTLSFLKIFNKSCVCVRCGGAAPASPPHNYPTTLHIHKPHILNPYILSHSPHKTYKPCKHTLPHSPITTCNHNTHKTSPPPSHAYLQHRSIMQHRASPQLVPRTTAMPQPVQGRHQASALLCPPMSPKHSL